MRRAQFLKHQLWVTRYHPEHRYPGGDFPNQNPRVGDGLPAWAAQDNSLRDASLVLWCVVSLSWLCAHYCVPDRRVKSLVH